MSDDHQKNESPENEAKQTDEESRLAGPSDNFYQGRLSYAAALAERGEFDKSIEEYTAITEIPDAPVDLIIIAINNRGSAKMSSDDLEGALKDFTMVIDSARAPTDQKAWALLDRATLMNRCERYQDAVDDHTALIKLEDATIEQQAWGYLERGTTFDFLGSHETAIRDFTTVLAMADLPEEFRVRAHRHRGCAYGNASYHEKAVGDFRDALQYDGLHPWQLADLHRNLGMALQDLKDFDGAEAEFSAVIEMEEISEEERAECLFRRGFLFQEQKKDGPAGEDFRAMLAIDEARVELRIAANGNLGWLSYRGGRYEESLEHSRQALEIDPDRSWILSNVGLVLLHMGKTEDAIATYKRAIPLFPDLETMNYHVIEDIKDALMINPDLKGAREVIEKANEIWMTGENACKHAAAEQLSAEAAVGGNASKSTVSPGFVLFIVLLLASLAGLAIGILLSNN